uniref:Uncharacterized protein TCIL3000_10_11080 n=1 Tax=Trypanosoma congolense (strain IL3000) TaxID=1068625 RepID=G0UY62_TRYCI|nr:unnamed protein product [Trypanosoma congolense IL3000]
MSMRQREQRRKRRRGALTPALEALVERASPHQDPSATLRFLLPFATRRRAIEDFAGNDEEADDFVIVDKGLSNLCSELGGGLSGSDLWAITRRIPRSRSTPECIDVTELCFVVDQVAAPTNVHDRRRSVGNKLPVSEDAPLLRHYKGDRFSALLGPVEDIDVEKEWSDFLRCIASPLPMTLRVHQNEHVLTSIARQFLEDDDRLKAVLRPLSLIMPRSAEIFGCSHAAYHTDSRVEYVCRTLHAASAVSFQEVVSALPVIAADIQPHHCVLDMCAAPGSKTLQALDSMLCHGWNSSGVSRGVMIVNEKDRVKATQTLPARLKRFHAPNAICTRCDAVQWPRLFHSSGRGDSTFNERRFDRVICDVPCSGDGTVRKEPSVASSWSAGYVKSLLPTQRALLRRGLDLLRVGGILVYSTCSLEPKEDEEVVCAGLELFGDAVELIDVPATLKECGVRLRSSGGLLLPNVSHLREPKLPRSYDGRKVLRVLPHRDDTGGFFIAAFRKRPVADPIPPPMVAGKLNQWTKGKLWLPVRKSDDLWCSIADFYGFDCHGGVGFSFYEEVNQSGNGLSQQNDPNGEPSCGLVPFYHLNSSGGPCRRIVLMTAAAAHMLVGTRPYKGPGVEIVSAGTRAFEAYDGKYLMDARCRWRVVVESASYLAPLMRERKLVLVTEKHPQLVKELLSKGFVWLQEHWQIVLFQDADACVDSLRTKHSSLCCAGPSQGADDMTGVEDPETVTVQQLIARRVVVGGLLLGLKGGKLPDGEGPWWLSATLSHTKLEIAVDMSLRSFGLLTFCGIESNNSLVPADASGS